MGNLNSDVSDDLDTSIDPVSTLLYLDTLEHPVIADDQQSVVAPYVPPPISTTPVSLTGVQTAIEALHTRRNALSDCSSLRDALLAKNAICCEDAVAIETFIGDFFTERLQKQSFSFTPSRVNFSQSIAFVETHIATESNALLSDSKAVIETAKTEANRTIEEDVEQHLETVLRFVRQLKLMQQATIETLLNSENVVVAFGTTFINVVYTPLSKINELKGQDISAISETCSEAINACITLFGTITPYVNGFFQYLVLANNGEKETLFSMLSSNAAVDELPFSSVKTYLTALLDGSYEKALIIIGDRIADLKHIVSAIDTETVILPFELPLSEIGYYLLTLQELEGFNAALNETIDRFKQLL